MIISRTPLRISLIGGGTDLPAFYEKHPGAVLSFAINKYIYVIVNDKFDGKYRISYSQTENVEKINQIKHDLIRECLGYVQSPNGLEIVTVADIPGTGTGLGSSSALTVGLLNCLHRKFLKDRNFKGGDPTPFWLAETAYTIEADKCHRPVGKQDHYAAAMGDFNFYQFQKKKVSFTAVSSDWKAKNPWSWDELHDYMLLLWTGISRPSIDILTEQKKNFSSGDTLEYGKILSALAESVFYNLVTEGDFRKLAKSISEGWELKKKLAPWVTNAWMDDWIGKAFRAGAWGGKLLGAGGGGFLFFIAPKNTHDQIVKATGLRKVDFNISWEGSSIYKRAGM